MKKNMTKKRVVKREEVGSWVYILLLTSITILGWVLGQFDFTAGKVVLTVAIFAYPFRYFVANIITKKYGYKETMNGISYSACLLLLFAIVANLLVNHDIDYVPLTGELFGYMVSQMINLSIYYYLLINANDEKIPYLGAYVVAMLADTLVSMLFASRLVILSSFWKSYFVTILIETIIAIFLIYFDKKKVYNPKKK